MPTLTKEEEEKLVYILLGEAGGEGKAGMEAVAYVMANRAKDPRWPDTLLGVATQGKGSQFNAAKPAVLAANMQAYSPTSSTYKTALSAVRAAASGTGSDPTGGALHYYANSGPNKISEPSWFAPSAKAGSVQIGNHVYAATRSVSTSRVSTSSNNVIEIQQGRVRDKPIDPKLKMVLNTVAAELGVQFEVTSGGQVATRDPKMENKRGGWIGSTRHDHGNAADVKMVRYVNGQKQYVSFATPSGQALWAKAVQLSASHGATGIGAGKDYMGTQTVHIGYGDAKTWGGGLKGKGPAPTWLQDAYKAGASNRTLIATTPVPATMSGRLTALRAVIQPPQPAVMGNARTAVVTNPFARVYSFQDQARDAYVGGVTTQYYRDVWQRGMAAGVPAKSLPVPQLMTQQEAQAIRAYDVAQQTIIGKAGSFAQGFAGAVAQGVAPGVPIKTIQTLPQKLIPPKYTPKPTLMAPLYKPNSLTIQTPGGRTVQFPIVIKKPEGPGLQGLDPPTPRTAPGAGAPKAGQTVTLDSGKTVELGRVYTIGNTSYIADVDQSGRGTMRKIGAGILSEIGKKTIVGGAINDIMKREIPKGVQQGKAQIASAYQTAAKEVQRVAGFAGNLFRGPVAAVTGVATQIVWMTQTVKIKNPNYTAPSSKGSGQWTTKGGADTMKRKLDDLNSGFMKPVEPEFIEKQVLVQKVIPLPAPRPQVLAPPKLPVAAPVTAPAPAQTLLKAPVPTVTPKVTSAAEMASRFTPASESAYNSGSSSYVTSGGVVMPTTTVSGTKRYTYGDESLFG